MCQFFSFVGDGYGNYKFSDWETRKRLLSMKGDNVPSPDSHTYLLKDLDPKLHDKWSKYEYNPWTRVFTIDQGVEGHDHGQAQKWVEARDWSFVCPLILVKPIVNPLGTPRKTKGVTKQEKAWLEEWDSLGDSLRASLGASLGDILRDSLGASLGASLRASLRASLGASLGAILWDSLRAYAYSFTTLEQLPGVKALNSLWDAGLSPSYDGKTWRLHAGEGATVVL